MIALACLPALSNAQSLTPAWQLTDMSRCVGCGGLLTADLDGDGIDEIIATAGESGSRYVTILKNNNDSFAQVWRSPWYADAPIQATEVYSRGDVKELYVLLSDGTIEVYETESFQLVRSGQLSATAATAMAIGDLDDTDAPRIVITSATHLSIYDASTFESLYESEEFHGTDVKLGDVDGDGRAEIVIGSRVMWGETIGGLVLDGATREVKWRFVDGFGSSIQLADVTGNGQLDIVAMRNGTYSTTVRAFDAALRTPLWEITSDLEHRSMIVDDINGSGELAIILGSRERGLQAFGVDTRRQMWSFTPTSRSHSAIIALATGIISADGMPKLILGGSSEWDAYDGLQIVDPQTRSTFWTSPDFGGPFAITHADLTGDGHNNVVIAARSNNFLPSFRPIWILDQNLETIGSVELPPAYYQGSFSLSAVDVTSDGRAEIFVSDGSNQLWMLGGEGWHVRYSGEVNGQITQLEVADIDADGFYEVVVSDAAGYLTVFDAHSLTKKWSTIHTGSALSGFTLADCRMDGSQDVILYARDGFVQAYSADQQLLWQADDMRGVSSMTAGDGQRTGVTDLYAGDVAGNIHVLDCADGSVKRSDKVFDEPIVSLWLGDLDAGHERDLVAGTTHMTLLRISDYETIWQSAPFSGEVGARGNLHVVDLDGDRFLDFLVGTSEGVAIYRSDFEYVDKHPPFASRVVPVDAFENASLNVPVQVTFSKAIAAQTLDHNSFAITHGNSQLDYSIQYDKENYRATAVPEEEWPENSTLTVILSSAITDTAGNAFDGNRNGIAEGSPEDDLIWSFTTGSGVDSLGPGIVNYTTSADTLWRGIQLTIEATAADTFGVATSNISRITAYLDEVDTNPFDLTPKDRTFSQPIESAATTFMTESWPYGTRTIWLVAEDDRGNRGQAVSLEIHLIVESEDNWVTDGRDNARTGFNPLDSLTTPFSTVWEVPLFERRSGPPALITSGGNPAAIADGVVYVSYAAADHANPSASAFVEAYSIEDGQFIWMWNGPATSTINPPTIAYGQVFVQGNSSNSVYALNARSGDLIWRERYESQHSRYGAPAVSNGTVTVGGGYYDGMMAFDAFTGEPLWFHNLPQVSEWTHTVFEGKAITPQFDGQIFAVNIDNGSTDWTMQYEDVSVCSRSRWATIDPEERILYAGSDRLIAIDLDDRSEIWTTDEMCMVSGIAVADETVYVAEYSGLHAIDKSSGDIIWRFEPNSEIQSGPAVSRAYVFISTEEKTYAIDRFSGEVVWDLEVGGGISLGNQHLIHVGHDGVLRAFVSGDPVNMDRPLAPPQSLTLKQNYPNPFSDRTNIRFEIPTTTRATLKIFNVLGQNVATLVDDLLSPGSYEIVWQANEMSSGVYFATLMTDTETRSVRLVLTR